MHYVCSLQADTPICFLFFDKTKFIDFRTCETTAEDAPAESADCFSDFSAVDDSWLILIETIIFLSDNRRVKLSTELKKFHRIAQNSKSSSTFLRLPAIDKSVSQHHSIHRMSAAWQT